jgi:ankyrin repeat protein
MLLVRFARIAVADEQNKATYLAANKFDLFTLSTICNIMKDGIGLAVSAAFLGETSTLRDLVGLGIDFNEYDNEGWTPLLAASVRGKYDSVQFLLDNGASVEIPHKKSGAFPIHFAGHSGSIKTAQVILNINPSHLDKIWELNGHTLLLQAVFYDHVDLTKYALERNANTAATTARGLSGFELAKQFQNTDIMKLIEPYNKSQAEKDVYYQELLRTIAEPEDMLIDTIIKSLINVRNPYDIKNSISAVSDIFKKYNLDVNTLGGALQQPALIVAVTGNNGEPFDKNIARLREELVIFLLDKGANPLLCEKHPMGINAIIRASVFNHLEILELMSQKISPSDLLRALNERPTANGLTALHDTILRASTARADRFDGYINQIKWCVDNGAKYDIEDYSGLTQLNLAKNIKDQVKKRIIMNAIFR